MKKTLIFVWLVTPALLFSQHTITIDGNFADWQDVPVAVTDPADDVHDTEGDYPDDGAPSYREYTDVDILEVKFSNDAENLYGYIKATGQIGRTSSDTLGHAKNGRYYFIFTIDVDDNQTTGYRLKDGGYYPDSRGYDMNMEVEYYNGGFNTGHYINHEYLTQAHVDTQGIKDLQEGVVRLAPGTYDYYTQWVTFEDSSYVLVSDRGPVYQGITTIAVSPDSHEAEIKAPMWGFLRTPQGQAIIDVGQYIVVSASLEGSGELSEQAGDPTGGTSVWGSDTAEPFRYYIADPATAIAESMVDLGLPDTPLLRQNYPNPFNPDTKISFYLPTRQYIKLSIFDILGRKVATLVEGDKNAGEHSVHWIANDDSNIIMPSGIYFAVLEGADLYQVKSMVFLK